MRVLYVLKPHRKGLEVLLREGFEVDVRDWRSTSRDSLIEGFRGADAVVVPPAFEVGEELLAAGSNIKLLVVHGSGYEKVDVSLCSKLGICVSNEPDAIAEAVAEHALALTLSVLRKVVWGHAYVTSGKWVEGPAPRAFLGRALSGKKVGVVGLGRIGSAVARIFKSLGCEVTYWSSRRKPEVEHSLGIKYVGLRELFGESDVVIISIALTPETEGFVSGELLGLMKEKAVLVNVSRGAVVDEEALIRELKRREIYAALDVFREEPLPKDSELMKLSNVVLTPHVAGYTYEAMVETGMKVAETIIKFFKKGEPPANALNPEVCRKGETV